MNEPILEHMCRACMCKDQTLHPLCDDSVDKSLTIYEMLAITIPQVPIHSNDELPKKICAGCLNTLIIVHKFQQMCIASDTYMRSLLVSNRLASHSKISEQQEEIKHKKEETEKFNIPVVTQDQHQFPRSIKVEPNDETVNESVFLEPTKYYQEIDTMGPNCNDDDDRLLKKSEHLNLVPVAKEEFQDCLTFEISNVEEQECDLMTSLRNKTVLLENREMHNDDRMDSTLDSYNGSDSNSVWDDGDNSRYQKKSTSNLSKAEERQTSTSSNTIEPNEYDIEKPKLKSRKYPCPYCDASFRALSNLKEHSRLHDKTRPFVCEVCNYRFDIRTNLYRHMVTHKKTPPGGFKCPKCPRRFEKQTSLSSHMIAHRKNPYKCNLCPQKFVVLTRLADHLRQHENQKFVHDNEKDNTSKDTNLEQSLEIDNDTNSEWNGVENSNCRKKSTTNVSKAEEQQPSTSSDTNKIEGPNSRSHLQCTFPCPHCDATFSSDSLLKTHSYLHDKTHPFPCEACNYRFKTRKGKLIHYKNKHKTAPPGGFKCPTCSRRFEKHVSVLRHMRTHRENLFKCDLCPKKFLKLPGLTKHLRQHKIQKLMPERGNDDTDANLDNDTNSEWNDADNSRYQKRSTSNLSKAEDQQPSTSSVTIDPDEYDIEKPRFISRKYPCPHCDASFRAISNLKEHSRLHDETRLFVCEVCNYRFESSTNLLRHKITHKTTPPGGFKCPKCPRRFEKPTSLSSHMNVHRENENINDNTDSNLEKNSGDDNDCQENSMSKLTKKGQTDQDSIATKTDASAYIIEKPNCRHKANFLCEQCDAAFTSSNKLELHARVHIATNLFVCEICNYRYKNRSLLARHITIEHDNNEPAPLEGYKCPECSRRFEKILSLKLHWAASHKKTVSE